MSPQPEHILVITHRRDVYVIDRVMDALRAHGTRPLRLDTDLFPTRVRAGLLSRGGEFECTLSDLGGAREGESIPGSRVRAVWTRSIWPPAGLDDIEPEYRAACASQSRAALEGLFDGLRHAHWMNDWRALLYAGNKPRQLRVAAAAGLTLPATLITNDADLVRRFHDTHGDIVAKVLVGLSMSMDRSGPFVPTSPVTADDLEHLDSLRFSPMIFQQRVAKAEELRVAFVDGQCFVGSIRAGADAPADTAQATDWRVADAASSPWRAGRLPAGIQAKLRDFMARMGLAYGAIDIIVTPSGEYVFLEVNPLGEWGMLERDLGLPISQAVADALVAAARNTRDTPATRDGTGRERIKQAP